MKISKGKGNFFFLRFVRGIIEKKGDKIFKSEKGRAKKGGNQYILETFIGGLPMRTL